MILAVLLSVVTGNPTVSAGNLLSSHDQALYKKAFKAAKNSNWANALGWAGKAQNPLPAKALQWMHYLKRGNQSKFSEIAAFLNANPNWPSIEILIRRAEEAMEISHISDQVALDWFTRHPPLTGPGQMRLAEAMLAMGLPEEGKQWLRYAWVNNKF
ncbi:MAG: lytic transglycosylase domain-containing protein, partial [Alphaproteobacteria bacterium]|nr:lytic transglycosylase domain-containing protein [Alphaproteobacteria bacterium]